MRTTVKLADGSEIEVGLAGNSGSVVMLPGFKKPASGREAEELKQWGVDPEAGKRFVEGLSDTRRVLYFDYEGHRFSHPLPDALTPDAVADDLLRIANATDEGNFVYYGYSWLALAGLQLAIRTNRVAALIMGGFPPYKGPYGEMLTVTEKTYEQSLRQPPAAADAWPGAEASPDDYDWENVQVTLDPNRTKQFHTLYTHLQDFDDAAVQGRLAMPRLAFAGERDKIVYGPNFGGVTVDIAGPLREHRDRLRRWGWDVELVPGDDADHVKAMQPETALPVLRRWLDDRYRD